MQKLSVDECLAKISSIIRDYKELNKEFRKLKKLRNSKNLKLTNVFDNELVETEDALRKQLDKM